MLEKQSKHLSFVYGSGHRKSAEQRDWERTDVLRQRWEGYEQSRGVADEGKDAAYVSR